MYNNLEWPGGRSNALLAAAVWPLITPCKHTSPFWAYGTFFRALFVTDISTLPSIVLTPLYLWSRSFGHMARQGCESCVTTVTRDWLRGE